MVGVAKATEKRSTFSPSGGVCQAVTARWARTPCTPATSTHFQVRKTTSKHGSERRGKSAPHRAESYRKISRLKGDTIGLGTRFGKCIYTTRMYWRLCVFPHFSLSERAVSSTPSSSKRQMEPASVSVKDEPKVCEWRVLLALGHIRPTIVATRLGYGWSPGRIRSSGPLELARLIGTSSNQGWTLWRLHMSDGMNAK